MSVQSRPGEGARFDILLPIVAPPERALAPDHLVVVPSPQPSPRILVVEDGEEVRELLSEVLTDAGYQVIAAVHGRDALRILDDSEVDLVVSDVVMPGLGGLELTEELRRRYPELPVLLMSGYAPKEAEAPGLRRLHKPFALADLLQAVSDALATSADEHRDAAG